MTIENVLEYVFHTPHNTNPAILDSMLRDMIISHGGTITDHTTDGFPIEWNTIEVKDNVSLNIMGAYGEVPLVKVSNFTPSADDVIGTNMYVTLNGETKVCPYLEHQDMDGCLMITYEGDVEQVFLVTVAGENTALGVDFPEAGLYAVNYGIEGYDANFKISVD